MSRWYWLILFSVYFILAVILYSPSLKGPWQYDDYAQILDTKVLTGRSVPTLFASVFRFTAWPDGWTGTRDFVRATFRLNWEWWGLKPAGYRWVNLTIHVINATLVAGLIWNLFSVLGSQLSVYGQPVFSQSVKTGKLKTGKPETENGKQKTDNWWIAALAGLLFLVHPIQSQAVAYVAQRFASVATLFYIATVVLFLLFIRYKDYKRYIFYGLSLLSALFAYNSKEITMTLPVALLFVTFIADIANNREHRERIFSRFSLRFAFFAILPFFLLALKIPSQIVSSSIRGAEKNVVSTIAANAFSLHQEKVLPTRQEYFLTELNVVRTYLRLLVLPVGQSLDWDYPITHEVNFPTALSALLHIGLIGVGLFLFFWSDKKVSRLPGQQVTRPAGFHSDNLITCQPVNLIGLGILWFYLTISVESSIIPIPDVFYEHRVYLPFVGVAIAMAGAAAIFYRSHKSYRTYMIAATTLWLLLLSAATFRRAWVWGDEVRLWADIYQKSPNKPRANKNYGVVLAARGNFQEGITRLTRAVELEPKNADYWSNLGTAYLRSGDYEHASKQFERAFTLYQEQYPIIKKFVNHELADASVLPEVRKQAAQYLNDFGVSMVQLGRGQEAKEAFERSLAIDPTLYAAKLGLGAAENLLGDIDGAIAVFSQLVKDHPDQADAYGNLATMYSKAKRYEEALSVLVRLKKLNPNFEGIDGRIAAVQKAMTGK